MSECLCLLKQPFKAQKSVLSQNAVQMGGTEPFSVTVAQDTAGA